MVWTLVARLLDSRVGSGRSSEVGTAESCSGSEVDDSFRLSGERARGVEPLFWKKTGRKFWPNRYSERLRKMNEAKKPTRSLSSKGHYIQETRTRKRTFFDTKGFDAL